jgi:hypothetical protein
LLVSNLSSDTTDAVTFDLSLMSGNLTSVGTNQSTSVGVLTKLTNVPLVGVEMGGRGDLNVGLNTTAVTGTGDALTLTLNNVGAVGTPSVFTVNGVETLNVVSNLVSNNVKLSDSSATKLVVTGSKSAFIDANIATNSALKTIDASGATGAVSVDLSGGDVANNVTLGTGGGTVYMGGQLINGADTLTGGSGTNDSLAITYAAASAGKTLSSDAKSITGFERLEATSTDSGANAISLNNISGITTVATGNVTEMTYAFGSFASNGSNASTMTIGINGNTITTASLAASTTAAAAATALRTAINNAKIGVTAGGTGTNVILTAPANSGVSITTSASFSETPGTGATGLTSQITFDTRFTNLAAGTSLELFGGQGGQEGTTALVQRNEVTATLKDASGTADAQSVKLLAGAGSTNSYTLDKLIVSNGTETLSIEAAAALSSDQKYTISELDASGLKTLNISGVSALDLGAGLTGLNSSALTTVNAASLSGALTLDVSDTAADIAVTGGSGNDTLVFGSSLNNKDTVDGGSGTSDSLSATIDGLTSTTGVLSITGVETLNLTATAAATIDATKMVGVDTLGLSGANTGGTVTITNLAAGTGLALGQVVSGGNDVEYAGTISVALKDATGTADSLKVTLQNDQSDTVATLKASGIETLNLVAASDQDDLDLTLTDFKASSIVVTGGLATKNLDLRGGASAALSTSTNSVDASAYKGTFTMTGGSGTAMTVTGAAGLNTITTSTGADTINIDGSAATVHVVDAGGGTDTLNFTKVSSLASLGSVSNVENFKFDVTSGAAVSLTTVTGFNNSATKSITVTGGSSNSTFKAAAIDTTPTLLTTIDASGYQGSTQFAFANDALVNTLKEIKGGSGTADTLVVPYDSNSSSLALKTSGVETLAFTFDTSNNGGETYSVDLASTSGVSNVVVANGGVAAAETITLSNLAAGTSVSLGSASSTAVTAPVASTLSAASVVTANLASNSGTADALTYKLVDTNDAAATVVLGATGIEALTLNVAASDEDHSISLANVAATSGSKVAVTVTGGKAVSGGNGSVLTITAMDSTINNINAADYLGNLNIGSGRNSTAMSITGGLGSDTIVMSNGDDILSENTGTGTLKISTAAILGGVAVNLSSTVDQITTFDGSANSAVQAGFENVDVSGYTGAFGANITASTSGSTITGTTNNDVFTGGAGVDTYNYTVTAGTGTAAGSDTFNSFSTSDVIALTAAASNTFQANGGTDVNLTSTAVAASNYLQTDNLTIASATGVAGSTNVIIEVQANLGTLSTITTAEFRSVFGTGGSHPVTIHPPTC